MMDLSSMTLGEAEAYRAGLAEGRHLGWAIGNAAGLRTGFEAAREMAVETCAGETLADPTDEPDDRAYNLAISHCIAAIRTMEPPA